MAAGEALLAAASDEEIDSYIDRTRFSPLTPRTVHSGAELWRDLGRVRDSGLALSKEESAVAIVGLARALQQDDRAVAALAVGLPTVRYDDAVDARLRDRLLAAADRLEHMLSRRET